MFNELNGDKVEINIDGNYLSYFRFADDNVLIGSNLNNLNMNYSKTKNPWQ